MTDMDAERQLNDTIELNGKLANLLNDLKDIDRICNETRSSQNELQETIKQYKDEVKSTGEQLENQKEQLQADKKEIQSFLDQSDDALGRLEKVEQQFPGLAGAEEVASLQKKLTMR